MKLTLTPHDPDDDGTGQDRVIIPGRPPRRLADLDADDLTALADSYRPESLPPAEPGTAL